MAGGDYGRIRHTFWTDPDIKRVLTAEQKTLLLYYFTSPHRSLVGLYYCPMEYAASETGLPLDRVRDWTLGALRKFVTYDEQTEEILVHRAGRHQVGDHLAEKDNQRKAIEKAVAEAHSPRLVRRFLELYAHWNLGIDVPPEPGPESEPPSKPLASPFEAKAVAVAVTEQNQSNPPGDALARVPDERVEVAVLDDEPPEVPGDVGGKVVPFRPAPIAGLPFGGMDWSGQLSGAHVLSEWIKMQPAPPSPRDRDRYGRACRQLSDEHTCGEIALAFLGICYLWPYGDPKTGKMREPWTPEDLRRVFVKAFAAAAKHPKIRAMREDRALDDALERRLA